MSAALLERDMLDRAPACADGMQAGMSLRGLTFYATINSDSVRPYIPDVPLMLPASSWARKNLRAPGLPAHITHTAADCGGFVATFKWGDYRYTPAQYVAWLETFTPRWAATMDYCCEDEITSGRAGVVRERQDRTTMMAHRFWRDYRRTPWAWVPTVQGWTLDDYQRHARTLRPLVDEMAHYYGPGSDFRVGIGTLCRRASTAMIRAVSAVVASELPGMPLHLWGIKLGALKSRIALPQAVASVDSAAWESAFAHGIEVRRASGLSEREHAYRVALPAYRAKVRAALNQTKQLTMAL